MSSEFSGGGGGGGRKKRHLDQVLESKMTIDDSKETDGSGGPTTKEEEGGKAAAAATTRQQQQRQQQQAPLPFLPLETLRLEAVFYPKFENENLQERNIRRRVLERCGRGGGRCNNGGVGGEGDGYLEASLKHSGSLLLWSGGRRFYSKNSTANAFTAAGEILLQPHFVRAFWNDNENGDDDDGDGAAAGTNKAVAGLQMYQECSDHVERHRLTLSFEVVTAVLSDHGARPRRDFLILTAVADRGVAAAFDCSNNDNNKNAHHFFYSTVQLVELAQRFRLPHNDVWLFASETSVRALFQLYDSCRETGTAQTVIPALTAAATAVQEQRKNSSDNDNDDDDDDNVISACYIESLYPHADFQGDILEGIVIRFVPFGSNTTNSRAQEWRTVARLAETSRRIRAVVPSDRPDCFELLRKDDGNNHHHQREQLPAPAAALTVNLRQVHRDCRVPYSSEGSAAFEARLRTILDPSTTTTTPTSFYASTSAAATNDVTISPARKVEKIKAEPDVPAWVKTLLQRSNSLDAETRQVATLIESLSNLSQNVSYSVYREDNNNNSSKNNKTRYICIVHVLHDQTFQKFQKCNTAGGMPLFRGFSFELMGGGGTARAVDRRVYNTANETMEIETTTAAEKKDTSKNAVGEESLMLKMKFLPYMVRTFGCRNGLKVVQRGGPTAFTDYTCQLLQRWGISPKAQLEWMPFFRAWSLYADRCLTGNPPDEAKDLPPLSAFHYLDHLEVFRELFESGKLDADMEVSDCKFQGLVVVVSVENETAEAAADVVSKHLGGARRIDCLSDVKQPVMAGACETGRGLVCSAAVEDGFGPVRKLLKNFANFIYVVIFQCSDGEIEELLLPHERKRKVISMLKGWRRTTCARVIELLGSSLFKSDPSRDNMEISPSSNFLEMISTLNEASEIDERPGLLVFFPAMPGCGKSSWVSGIENEVKTALQSPKSGKPRNLVVQIGDKTKDKFWPLVKRTRINDRSCIFIADKNAPDSIWSQIGLICAATKAMAVPVLPDGMALRTTRVEGMRKPDGTVVENCTHLYPFSLPYLAVCMTRVMERPAGTHAGKLDSSTARACMIVVKFFSFYRKITADEFLATVASKLASATTLIKPSPIEVPFFASESANEVLPSGLQEVLIEAIQAQYGYDRELVDASREEDNYLDDLEARLRGRIKEYRDFVLGLAADESDSCSAFASLLMQKVDEIERLDVASSSYEAPTFVKLASVDVDVHAVHQILLDVSKRNEALESFLDGILEGNSVDKVLSSDSTTGLAEKLRFVMQTHVTLAHFNRTSQPEMIENFEPLSGSRVQLSSTALLWSAHVMALEVAVAAKTDDGKVLPQSENTFVHITVWFQEGSKAFSANELPELCEKGEAQRVDFGAPIPLSGKVSLWKA